MALPIEHRANEAASPLPAWDWIAWLRQRFAGSFDAPICHHCGCSLFDAPKGKEAKPRSLPHHRRLFAVIGAAFDQWPEGHEFHPETAEHLRSYLICCAGPEFREVHRVNLPDVGAMPELTQAITKLFSLSIESVMRVVRERHKYSFIRPHPSGGSVAIYVPLSMSFESMAHKRFVILNDKIEEVLRANGLDPEQLLLEKDLNAA